MLSRKIVWLFLFFAFVQNTEAQPAARWSCDVEIDGKSLAYPFTGGLNTPQTYNIDFDLDGIEDLVIMDRSGGAIIPMRRINDGINLDYEYAPEYEQLFGDIQEWFVVRDFNGDGIKDIFSFPQDIPGIPGIAVRRGKVDQGKLSFEPMTFDNFTFDVLSFELGSTTSQVYVSSTDQPEIIDVDGDGDLDVLSFEPNGFYLNYYKNMVIEENLGLDTFKFVLEDVCWGKFLESEFSEDISLSNDPCCCPEQLQGQEVIDTRGGVHSGSTVTAFDQNNDDILDLCLGDLTNENISSLVNGGTKENAWMIDQDGTYPSYDEPVDISIFNAVFHVDVNNDGNRDLLASPNLANGDNKDVQWYFENVGTDKAPDFEFKTKTFLVNEMIDLGQGTYPTLVDLNGDDLLDMVVGTTGEFIDQISKNSRLVYFENIGSKTEPKFRLADNDYLDMAQYAFESRDDYAPTFGDIDGDLDLDLVVGDRTGFLYFFENTSNSAKTFDFKSPVYQYMSINPGNVLTPQIVDVNGDGLGDLIIGEARRNQADNGNIGCVNYFENIGSIGNAIFDPDPNAGNNTPAFGSMDIDFQTFSYAAPCLYQNEGVSVLLVGSALGPVSQYKFDKNEVDGTFEKLDSDFLEWRLGDNTSVALGDLNSDGKLDAIVGNVRGGLSLFTTNLESGVSATKNLNDADIAIEIYPNPMSDFLSIHNTNGTHYKIRVTNENAQVVLSGSSSNIFEKFSMKSIPDGIYFVEIEVKGQIFYQKVLKLMRV